jgi:hypothetical protein
VKKIVGAGPASGGNSAGIASAVTANHHTANVALIATTSAFKVARPSELCSVILVSSEELFSFDRPWRLPFRPSHFDYRVPQVLN